jgi:hypothetical protein
LTFIVSEIFTLSSMAVLAFGLSAVRPFRFSLSGHPKWEIGHDEGKLTDAAINDLTRKKK